MTPRTLLPTVGVMAAVRATPANPFPGLSVAEADSADQRAMPPELGPDAIAVLEGPTFMYSDACGDVPTGCIGGLVHVDTRLLTGWVLTINGGELLPLRAGTIDHYSAAFFLTNPELPGLPPNSSASGGCATSATASTSASSWCSFRPEPDRIELRLAVGADFADLFEIKDRGPRPLRRDHPRPRAGRLGAVLLATATASFSAADPGRGARRRPTGSRATTWSGSSTWPPTRTWSVDLHVPLPARDWGWSSRSGATSADVVQRPSRRPAAPLVRRAGRCCSSDSDLLRARSCGRPRATCWRCGSRPGRSRASGHPARPPGCPGS